MIRLRVAVVAAGCAAHLSHQKFAPEKSNAINDRRLMQHNLEAYLDAYIEAAGLRDGGKTPLFRSVAGRTGMLTEKQMNRVNAWRMIQRRAADLGTRVKIGCHTFRATGITAYLQAGGTLQKAQAMAAHESPRTPSSMTVRAMKSRSTKSSG
jgi:integrase